MWLVVERHGRARGAAERHCRHWASSICAVSMGHHVEMRRERRETVVAGGRGRCAAVMRVMGCVRRRRDRGRRIWHDIAIDVGKDAACAVSTVGIEAAGNRLCDLRGRQLAHRRWFTTLRGLAKGRRASRSRAAAGHGRERVWRHGCTRMREHDGVVVESGLAWSSSLERRRVLRVSSIGNGPIGKLIASVDVSRDGTEHGVVRRLLVLLLVLAFCAMLGAQLGIVEKRRDVGAALAVTSSKRLMTVGAWQRE